MYKIKKIKRLPKYRLKCVDLDKNIQFIGIYNTYESEGIGVIKAFDDIICKIKGIDGTIFLKKGVYEYAEVKRAS